MVATDLTAVANLDFEASWFGNILAGLIANFAVDVAGNQHA
jgi:hypothetical protein